jgi:hypothetical protein
MENDLGKMPVPLLISPLWKHHFYLGNYFGQMGRWDLKI